MKEPMDFESKSITFPPNQVSVVIINNEGTKQKAWLANKAIPKGWIKTWGEIHMPKELPKMKKDFDEVVEDTLNAAYWHGELKQLGGVLQPLKEAILAAHREGLNNAEEYAKEGWDWVEEFCQISGQKDVFQLRDYLQALDSPSNNERKE